MAWAVEPPLSSESSARAGNPRRQVFAIRRPNRLQFGLALDFTTGNSLMRLGFLLWLAICLFGFAALARYSGTPGSPGSATAHWPTKSIIRCEPDRFHLVVFMHPLCPCSSATLNSIERIRVASPRELEITVALSSEKQLLEAPESHSRRGKIKQIPAVSLIEDVDGIEASFFGARTSGAAFLYGPRKNLLFSGGLTPARGHCGDCDGLAAVADALRNSEAVFVSTPVFGCELLSDEAR